MALAAHDPPDLCIRQKGNRFPRSVSSHAVSICDFLALSRRQVGDLPLERGVIVSHETISARIGTLRDQTR